MNKSQVCHVCGIKTATLMQCANCKSVPYCSKKCQRNDWPNHKNVCANIKILPSTLEEKFYNWINSENFHPWEKIPTPKNHIWVIEVKDIDNIGNSDCIVIDKDKFCNGIKAPHNGDNESTISSANAVADSIDRAFSQHNDTDIIVCANLYHPHIDRNIHLTLTFPRISAVK